MKGIEETIETLKLMRAEVEGEYTMEYSVAIDNAINALQRIESVEKTKSKWLDTLESALVIAEGARKDMDLILVMRIIRDILKEEVRKNDKQQKTGDGV